MKFKSNSQRKAVMRKMTFNLQKQKIGNLLEKKGINKDLIDLDHELDRTLTYNENLSELNDKIGFNINSNKIKGKLSSFETFLDAEKMQDLRSNRSKSIDAHLRANSTFYPDSITKVQYKKWLKNPHRNDIENIDTKGSEF